MQAPTPIPMDKLNAMLSGAKRLMAVVDSKPRGTQGSRWWY